MRRVSKDGGHEDTYFTKYIRTTFNSGLFYYLKK